MTNTTPAAKDTSVRYEVTLTVTRPVRYDHDAPMSEQEEWAISSEAKRELVREVFKAMRVLDGVCDCEVMSAHIVSE